MPPEPPPRPLGFFGMLRLLARMRPEEQRKVVAGSASMQFGAVVAGPGVIAFAPLAQPPATREGFAMWLLTEAVRRGLLSPFKSAYQVWMVFARMLLRDDDIARLVRTHAEHRRKYEWRPRKIDAKAERALDLESMAEQHKRVDRIRVSFGHDSQLRSKR